MDDHYDMDKEQKHLLNAVADSALVVAALMWSAFACGVVSGATAIAFLFDAIR
jgi:hypothetical protein